MTVLAAMAAAALAGCLAVEPGADSITAGDLARAVPAFRAVPANTVLAFAPAPGVARVFRRAELRRLAVRYGVPGEPQAEPCFARRQAALDAGRLLAAMQRQLPEARIEVVEFTRGPVPAGELEFSPAGLRRMGGEALWTGWVRYAPRLRWTVWARVRVTMTVTRVVAGADLAAGRAIASGQLRVEKREEFPEAGTFATTIGECAGKAPRRPVTAGSALRREWLAAPKVVQTGDTVEVEVRNGNAFLKVPGRAEGAGAIGETIPVRNLSSHKRFSARVEARGKVSVGL